MNRHARTITAILIAAALLLSSAGAFAEKTIVVTFTGDCTLGSEEATRSREDSFDSIANSKGYDYFFVNFREMFETDDLTVINFEGVLSDNKADETSRKRYRFRGPTDFVKILTGSSIEAAGISNNHIGDYGKQGEKNTKLTLEENGVAWFQNFKYYVFEKDGISIAFYALENRVIYNEFDKLKKSIQDVKKSGEADAVVICWHTGLEYRGTHEENTERTATALIKYGADLVIMHHPHVLQGIGISNNRCIFYSLGNFVFGGNSAIRTEKFKVSETVTSLYSMVVQVRFTFSDEGTYLGQQATIYPVYTSSAAPVNSFQPMRVNAEDAIPVRDAIQRDTLFELPEILETDGLSRIELEYLPTTDEVMLPEGSDADNAAAAPEAASATPTRDNKGN